MILIKVFICFIHDFPLRCARDFSIIAKASTPLQPQDRAGPSDGARACRLLYLRSEGSTFQALQWPQQQWAELSWVGFSVSYSRSRIQGSRFNGVCDGANKRWAGWRWTGQDLCSCLRASNDRDQINEECGIYRMPNSVGKRFKPTKYIPVSTTATLLVGSTTLFFVFT